jgi:hypothetical protein
VATTTAGVKAKRGFTVFFFYISMVSCMKEKVEISLYANVIMLITIKLFKLIDRFIPFWWEEELCLLSSEFRDRPSPFLFYFQIIVLLWMGR